MTTTTASPATPSATPKVALITGITGQDGSYLAELLLEKGYVVHGIKRRASSFNTSRVDHIYQDPHIDNARFKLHYGDLSDTSNLTRIIHQASTSELYGLVQEIPQKETTPFYPRSPYAAVSYTHLTLPTNREV